ncbi:MAG: hypothetical protein HGA49_00125 [Eubacteriaceae bacterium]|nr:hypothetical protein [Eubacteriaceae bacterium]
MRSYEEEFNELKLDTSRIDSFKASGEDGTRIFNVLNSNIKTLKTVGEYIDTMYSQTTYDATHKQKNRRVKEFNFRSLDNRTDARAVTRSNIVIAAGTKFGGYDSGFVTLLLYILLLDIGSGKSVTAIRTNQFLNDLPVFIKRNLYLYARKIVASGSLLTDNIYQVIVVFFGDEPLYKAFLEFAKDHYPDEERITELFVREAADPSSPITKRLENFQRSALKKDALYAVIFYSLDQYTRKCKMHGLRTGNKIVRADDFLMGYLNYFNVVFEGALSWLGQISGGDDIDTLKQFIVDDLSEDQRRELYSCIKIAFDL